MWMQQICMARLPSTGHVKSTIQKQLNYYSKTELIKILKMKEKKLHYSWQQKRDQRTVYIYSSDILLIVSCQIIWIDCLVILLRKRCIRTLLNCWKLHPTLMQSRHITTHQIICPINIQKRWQPIRNGPEHQLHLDQEAVWLSLIRKNDQIMDWPRNVSKF